MTNTGDALTRLDELLADGYSVVDITSSTRTIDVSLEKPHTRETVSLNREDARRMLQGEPAGLHPLLA